MSKYSHITKEVLIELYINQKLSSRKVAEILGIPAGSIRQLLAKFGVESRKSKGSQIDLVGLKVNMVTVVQLSEEKTRESNAKNKKKVRIWECKCECGGTCYAKSEDLTSGIRKSCGCLNQKCGSQSRLWKGHGEISSVFFLSVKRHALGRKLEFSVEIQDLWKQFLKQGRKCALSGVELEFKKNYKHLNTASLDRIDSSLGYTVDNIQFVHKDVNIMKQDYSEEEFINYCKLVAEHCK